MGNVVDETTEKLQQSPQERRTTQQACHLTIDTARPPIPQAHIAQAEDPQQSCQQADRHIHEEDGGPAKTRQEQATDAWSRDSAQGSERTDKAHGAPALAR